MKTMKFGGTSLSNAKKFLQVTNIIEQKKQYDDISVVLSAPSNITNYLEKIIHHINDRNQYNKTVQKIKKIIYEIINDIDNYQNNFQKEKIFNFIYSKVNYIYEVINEIHKNNNHFDSCYSKIISIGEIISIKIMKYILIARNHLVYVINPTNFIETNQSYKNATVNITKTKNNIKKIHIPNNHIILMPGFIGGNKNKELVTLGRNGSDYSAAILSVCLNSNICEIWTDVDGVYTADPKIVENAQLIPKLSFQEAMELSYLGAKVLHPKTISPLSKNNIKCIIKNTYFPERDGTIIENNIYRQHSRIIGITYLKNITMIRIKIVKLINFRKMSKKIISILLQNKVKIISVNYSHLKSINTIYTLNQTEYSIKRIMINELNQEIIKNIIKIIKIHDQLKIISIIHSNIKKKTNNQIRIFSSIKHTDLNIISINKEVSKNAISIVTNNNNISKNINIIHEYLFHTNNTSEIFIIGIGGVGKTLLDQLTQQQLELNKKNIKFKVCGITNSKKMLINLDGIKLSEWKQKFKYSNENFCIDRIIQYTKSFKLFNPIIIDCTSSQEISNSYCKILKNKIHIVTPNKKANSNNWNEYQKIRDICIKTNKKFLYETNVSAGIPVIHTLKNLFNSGDELIKFQGILSGSLSFIFGKLEEGMSISESTKEAKKLGFTEPNPKDDLSGMDVARKLLIIARESGHKIELKDIEIESIIPKELLDINNTEEFLTKLCTLDNEFLERTRIATHNNKVLRFVGTIEQGGIYKVQLIAIKNNHPLYNIKNGENALIIHSKYYQPMPLILRGYGAGYNVTAAGIFSDLLKILS